MSNSTNAPRVMTPREAAAYTGWSIHEVYRRLERGVMPGAVKLLDGRWEIRREPLDRWLRGEDSK